MKLDLRLANMNGSFEQMSNCYEFIESRKNDECCCPEEDWIIGMLYTTIHIEPDGSGHIFIDSGNWEDEKLVPTKSIEELRVAAVNWVESFPINNEL